MFERARVRREEEERLERDRKMAAQKKLQELEEKTKKQSDGLKEKDVVEEKKYGGDKYNDAYDNYGRGAPPGDFKKTSFQSNLPPRFQKQHNEKPQGNYGKPMHQETKNAPFGQQQSSFEQQRWSYNKQMQQAPPTRRHISSLSQSSSDDNRRENSSKGYGRRRQESEEDDYRKKQAAQITRSMSDSSDKLSDHNRSEKSASREYLGAGVCWAEACENEKRPTVDNKTRRVSESSAMSDDAPRTILQRKQPEKKEEKVEEKKTVLSDVQPVKEVVESKEAALASVESKKNLESIPEKTDVKEVAKVEAPKSDERQKKFDSRDSRYAPSTRGNFNSYRGGNSYSRRGGSGGGPRRYDYSDSENSDDEWNRNGQKKRNFNAPGGPKEGFSPRGEPSRRGRGGIATQSSSGFRRSGSNGAVVAPAKNYGPPSSKSPFGSNDEKSSGEKHVKEKSEDDDRTKQKQKALSDGLLNKSQKESSNVAVKAAEKEKTEETVKQHSTEPEKKPEKKPIVDESKSFVKKPAPKLPSPVVAKPASAPPQQQQPPPNQYQQQSSQQKPMNQINRNDDRSRMDPRNSSQNAAAGNNRMAPRFTANKQGPPQGNIGLNRTSTSFWDKNHEEAMQSMQSAPPSNNLLKTDAMKPQSMQQQPPMDASLKTTLIFENTSYKRPPPPMGQPLTQKTQENTINTINDMIDQQNKEQQQQQQSLSALQNLSFGSQQQKPPQNDMVDMNFSYTSFDSQIGGLLNDKSSGFAGQNANQTVSKVSSLGLVDRAKTGSILNTDALNMKVASCKKVWEESTVSGEHGSDDVMSNFVQHQQHLQHYVGHNNMPQTYGYGSGNNDIEHFSKSNDVDDSASYPSPQQQQQHMQQVQQQKAAEAFSTANVCKVKPTQQQMHQSGLSPPPQMQQHQPYYSTPSYTNMPTIPSPPAVVYPQQASYNPYGSMEAARAAQLAYGYPTGGANNSMSFNAFMQQPNLTSAPTHEMYQNLSQYRAAVQPFNQNNPLLISSATSQQKPQNSQIGAIGSKSSSSSASGQYNQQYMNHVYHHQQNSYYTNSTAQQANPYYSGPPTGSGGATSGNYGMFASQNNGPPPQQPQQMANFGSVGQYPLGSQMLNSLVINQQFRSGPVVNTGNGSSSGGNSNAPGAGGNYMKQQHQSQLQDPVSSTTFFKNV